ncbi:hypothetical protein PIB30_116340 [Stylosanthes scabra]|uniref:Uncharacterized protein n=1 Tax=Stylosanthes scabra TaxID=79078 RepID=A0ABU6T344_9FABA|nr:hypothetical protein [Stylosanthes scabra]
MPCPPLGGLASMEPSLGVTGAPRSTSEVVPWCRCQQVLEHQRTKAGKHAHALPPQGSMARRMLA